MSRPPCLLVLCALLIPLSEAAAQEPAIDSLRHAMRTQAMSDSAYAAASGKLAQHYWLNGEMDSVLANAERGISRLTGSSALSVGLQKQLVRLVKLKGMAFFSMRQWHLAMEGFRRMRSWPGPSMHDREQGRALTYEGHTLREMGDNVNSAASYRAAFAELEPLEQGTIWAMHTMASPAP